MQNFNEYNLSVVNKPARYVGGEYNSVIKSKDKIRFALCFPDIYEIGMSNISFKILYDILNKRDDVWAERAYSVELDFEEFMKENNILLYGLESKSPLKEFDILGFNLQYELSYTNILNMLKLSGIPLLSNERDENYPLIKAGGPCSSNPYPLSKFIDIFLLGDGEELVNIFIDKYKLYKENKLTKLEFYNSIKDIQGVFIPSIHTSKDEISKACISDLDKYPVPTKTVVPNIEIVQDKVSVEVLRGCYRGCRFCQAGYIYRPQRERKIDNIVKYCEQGVIETGNNEVGLSSLSTSDHSDFLNLATKALEIENVNINLPSLRIDSLTSEMFEKLNKGKRGSFTFAPEAGSQRLRDVINKNISEEEVLNSCKKAFLNGYTNIKLYFMIGLPTETYEDLQGIVDLTHKIIEEYYSLDKSLRKGKCNIRVSASTFVPKPHTPFEFCKQDTIEEIMDKQKFLNDRLKHRCIKYAYHDPYTSKLEAVISRGDSKVCDVIYKAFLEGARFDSWEEHLNKEAWNKALELIDVDSYIYTDFDLDHEFCFDNIFHGVTKEFLKREYLQAINGKTSLDCSKRCNGCGVDKLVNCKFKK